MGFVLDSRLLIVAGALDGASGLILSIIMCRAGQVFHQRAVRRVGQTAAVAGAAETRHTRKTLAGAAHVLEQARRVIVPGYGMAVAQAQHRCEL